MTHRPRAPRVPEGADVWAWVRCGGRRIAVVMTTEAGLVVKTSGNPPVGLAHASYTWAACPQRGHKRHFLDLARLRDLLGTAKATREGVLAVNASDIGRVES